MITKLQHCHPDFVKKCCPEQLGFVIVVDGAVLLLTESSVLLTSVVGVRLLSPEGEQKWWWENGQLRQHCHYKNHYKNGEREGEYKS